MTLLQLITEDELLMALGAYDAVSASIAEQEGAKALYMSGSAVSTALHGGPDIGLTTMSEMARRVDQIKSAVDVPLIADGDTGYGNAMNVRRTVERYERAGASAIQLEDQDFPKRCGHFEGKELVSAGEFASKIVAATDARQNNDFLIIARTDAIAVKGIDAAIRRARLYRDAGADVLFIEAPTKREDMEEVVSAVDGNHLANMAAKGQTPHLSAEELEEIGYDMAIYPTDSFKAALKTFQDVYGTLVQERTQKPVLDEMVEWEERDRITEFDRFNEYEDRYEQKAKEYESQYEDTGS